VPQEQLLKYLEALKPSPLDAYGGDSICTQESGDSQVSRPLTPVVGVGLDCAITPLKRKGLVMVQTTDFFYPLVEDPYMMGRIACCNVLSDMYAVGAYDCDNMLMLLGVPISMEQSHRDVVIPLMMKGFRDQALLAGTSITGGQTVLNPWLIIGGVATSVTDSDELILPDGACSGDVLILTKPLGTQLAVNAKQWLTQGHEKWAAKLQSASSIDEIDRMYRAAKYFMSRMNRTGSQLMCEYNAHCATDVTGFGLLGHARNLAQSQRKKVSFIINNLPMIKGANELDKNLGRVFKLTSGTSAETSGGLLIAVSREHAQSFTQEFQKRAGHPCWIIGVVHESENSDCRIVDQYRIIEVDADPFIEKLGSKALSSTDKIPNS
jgi:selenide,water dikinase